MHILGNYQWDSKALLPLVLIGLPETRQRLSLAKNRSLWSRIHTRLSLGEAAPGDTAEYIGYRLKHAGADRELLSSDAIALIHEETHGRLHDIDRIATDALKLGGPSRRVVKPWWKRREVFLVVALSPASSRRWLKSMASPSGRVASRFRQRAHPRQVVHEQRRERL